MSFSAVSKKNGKTYYLHSKEFQRSNGIVTFYFFKGTDSEEGVAELPEGYEVWEFPSTGLPILKKIR